MAVSERNRNWVPMHANARLNATAPMPNWESDDDEDDDDDDDYDDAGWSFQHQQPKLNCNVTQTGTEPEIRYVQNVCVKSVNETRQNKCNV